MAHKRLTDEQRKALFAKLGKGNKSKRVRYYNPEPGTYPTKTEIFFSPTGSYDKLLKGRVLPPLPWNKDKASPRFSDDLPMTFPYGRDKGMRPVNVVETVKLANGHVLKLYGNSVNGYTLGEFFGKAGGSFTWQGTFRTKSKGLVALPKIRKELDSGKTLLGGVELPKTSPRAEDKPEIVLRNKPYYTSGEGRHTLKLYRYPNGAIEFDNVRLRPDFKFYEVEVRHNDWSGGAWFRREYKHEKNAKAAQKIFKDFLDSTPQHRVDYSSLGSDIDKGVRDLTNSDIEKLTKLIPAYDD